MIKLLIYLTPFCLSSVNAQEATVSTGGDISSSSGTVAYSVGQVVYTANSSSTGNSNQGVQQAYEVYTVGLSEHTSGIQFQVFPNPAVNELILQVSDKINEPMEYQVFDAQGKQLASGVISEQQTSINMAALPPATYIVRVVSAETLIQLFKIVKN